MVCWSLITCISYMSKAFMDDLHSFYAKSQYLVLIWPGMMSTSFWDTSWIISAHSWFLHNLYLEFVVISGFLFVHLPHEDWPQVLSGMEVWGVSWPSSHNVNVLLPGYLVILFALWHHHLTSSPNILMVGRYCCGFHTILYSRESCKALFPAKQSWLNMFRFR